MINRQVLACLPGYYERDNACYKIPDNASGSDSNRGFRCDTGYQISGNICIKKINMPANAHSSGNSWICNTDYYRSSNLKACVRVPANASSSYNSNYWNANPAIKELGMFVKKN